MPTLAAISTKATHKPQATSKGRDHNDNCKFNHASHEDVTFTDTMIKNRSVKAMIDSGSKHCFIGRKTAKRLKLYVIPTNKRVVLADPTHTSDIVGEVVADIIVNGQLYIGQVVYALNDQCVDLILGKDFMKRHKSVTFHFGGSEPPVSFGKEKTVCAVTAMKVEPPKNFSNMSPDSKPVACKSRRYSPSDHRYIEVETKRLLEEGIIEPVYHHGGRNCW